MDGRLIINQSVRPIRLLYMDGINFINRLAVEAEKTNHHPDMIVGWCKVVVTFTSHDKGGVTEQCIMMAKSQIQYIKTF